MTFPPAGKVVVFKLYGHGDWFGKLYDSYDAPNLQDDVRAGRDWREVLRQLEADYRASLPTRESDLALLTSVLAPHHGTAVYEAFCRLKENDYNR